jgi:hypothetical protein
MSGDVPRSSSLPDFLRPEGDVLERAWDIVWWRRLAYFTTLAVTAYLTLFALRLAFTWPNWFLDATEATFRAVFGARIAGWFAAAWTWLLGFLTHVLPGWANVLVPSFDAYPLSSALALILLAVLFFWIAERLQDRIAAHAEWAWAAQKGLPLHGEPSADWLNIIARPGRVFTAWLYRLWRAFFVYVAGCVLGVVALIVFSPFWVFRVFRRRPWMA